jgi:hypothetical protein
MRPQIALLHFAAIHCVIRNTVFHWTRTRFPFHASSAKKLALNQTLVITVTGKAFFDVGHSLKDQRLNHRSHLPGYAAWEIHPVMKIAINDRGKRLFAFAFFSRRQDREMLGAIGVRQGPT